MISVLSVDNMRKSDAYTIKHFVPGRELMYRAGKGVFDAVAWKPPVAVVCGSGNNAGDGYVIAKLLHDAQIGCTVFLLSDKFSEDGRYYYEQCVSEKISILRCDEQVSFKGYATIADCIFGTGFKGRVRGLARAAISSINSSDAYVVSVDINSGLDGDSGIAELCVISDITVSVGGFKPGHFLGMAKEKMKSKVNCDIGIKPAGPPYYLMEKSDFAGFLPKRLNCSNKGTYGYAALIGGSLKYSGAIRLACMANAAVRAGAGAVKIAAPRGIYKELIPVTLEGTWFPLSDENCGTVFNKEEIDTLISDVRTVAFGMGIGVTAQTEKMLNYLIKNYAGTLIIDADGLTILSQIDADVIRSAKGSLILAPHLKEFSGMLHCGADEVLASPIALAVKYAKEHNVILLLKGPAAVITDGERTYMADAGCTETAAPGKWDVLSGIASAICAYCDKDLLMAAALSAYISGKAGEYAQRSINGISMIHRDTVSRIPEVISGLFSG